MFRMSLSAWFVNRFGRSRRLVRNRPSLGRLRLEALETRCLPSVTVNSTLDLHALNPATGPAANVGGDITLRSAIEYADMQGGNQTILFNASVSGQTITLNSSYGLLYLGDNTGTLNIQNSGAPVVISGNYATEVFYGGPNATSVLTDLTIENGRSTLGGGIDNRGTLTLNNCTLSGNSGFTGGAIFSQTSLTLNNCTLSGNVAGENGGAFYLSAGHAVSALNNCTITGNSAYISGGAIYDDQANLTLTGCTLSGNTAQHGQGGAISAFYFATGSVLTLTNCNLGNNMAGTSGGALATNFDSATLTNCSAIGNSAGGSGGAIANGDTLIVNNCTIANNTAANGGGIFSSASLLITDSTISGNTAISGGLGGGIANGRYMAIVDGTISGNVAGKGGGIYQGAGPPYPPSSTQSSPEIRARRQAPMSWVPSPRRAPTT
jgi:hypothetical protein